MRARLALLLLPLALLLWLARPHTPVEVPLHLHLGARGATVQHLELLFQRDDAVIRDLQLQFPDGAPADVERSVRLAPGDYAIAVKLVDREGREARDTRRERVEPGQPVSLDLAFLR